MSSIVVSRHKPSLPVWAWMFAASVSLLVLVVGMFVASRFPTVEQVKSKPVVEVTPRQPAASYPLDGPQKEQPLPTVVHDWSEPSEHFRPPPEPKAEAVKPKRIRVVVGEPAPKTKPESKVEAKAVTGGQNETAERIVPPPVRIHPEPKPDTPANLRYGNVTWKLSGAPEISSEEVSLIPSGDVVDGRGVYILSGETEPSVLFVETSPGSGQFKLYRPVG